GSSFALDYGVIIGMVVLATSVLGWIGEFTLATVAQMGFGLVAVNLCQDAGLPFLLSMPLVILSSIPISVLLGVFALRLRGAYFGMLRGLVPSNYFQPALAILYFGFAVAGGMGSVAGACAAGIGFGAIPKYFDSLSEGHFVGYDQFFIGVVALALVLWAPGGFAD